MRHNRIRAIVCVLVTLAISSCSWPVRERKEVSSEPITAILGAFEREITLLEDQPTDTEEQKMEGAAVAQICYQRRIPHLVIRSISDKADEGAVPDKQTFQMTAAKNSASLVTQIIKCKN